MLFELYRLFLGGLRLRSAGIRISSSMKGGASMYISERWRRIVLMLRNFLPLVGREEYTYGENMSCNRPAGGPHGSPDMPTAD
jgi:hypothetical protein